MRVLVTGANGFIGSHLCEALVVDGHEVRALVRRTSDLQWLEGVAVELVHGDLRDEESLRAAVAGVGWVFHTAADVRPKDPADYEKVNYEGSRLLAEACADAGVERFVMFSSAAAGGPATSPERPSCETDASHPVSRYGRGKLMAERAVLELAGRLRSVVLRFPPVYGPRDRDGLSMMRVVKRGIRPILRGTFSTVYVADAVRAAMQAAAADVASGSVYYISDGNCYDYPRMGRVAARNIGRRALGLRVPGWLLRFAGFLSGRGGIFNPDKAHEMLQDCWVCSPERARAELGFVPAYDIEQGLAETIGWYKERGWL